MAALAELSQNVEGWMNQQPDMRFRRTLQLTGVAAVSAGTSLFLPDSVHGQAAEQQTGVSAKEAERRIEHAGLYPLLEAYRERRNLQVLGVAFPHFGEVFSVLDAVVDGAYDARHADVCELQQGWADPDADAVGDAHAQIDATTIDTSITGDDPDSVRAVLHEQAENVPKRALLLPTGERTGVGMIPKECLPWKKNNSICGLAADDIGILIPSVRQDGETMPSLDDEGFRILHHEHMHHLPWDWQRIKKYTAFSVFGASMASWIRESGIAYREWIAIPPDRMESFGLNENYLRGEAVTEQKVHTAYAALMMPEKPLIPDEEKWELTALRMVHAAEREVYLRRMNQAPVHPDNSFVIPAGYADVRQYVYNLFVHHLVDPPPLDPDAAIKGGLAGAQWRFFKETMQLFAAQSLGEEISVNQLRFLNGLDPVYPPGSSQRFHEEQQQDWYDARRLLERYGALPKGAFTHEQTAWHIQQLPTNPHTLQTKVYTVMPEGRPLKGNPAGYIVCLSADADTTDDSSRVSQAVIQCVSRQDRADQEDITIRALQEKPFVVGDTGVCQKRTVGRAAVCFNRSLHGKTVKENASVMILSDLPNHEEPVPFLLPDEYPAVDQSEGMCLQWWESGAGGRSGGSEYALLLPSYGDVPGSTTFSASMPQEVGDLLSAERISDFLTTYGLSASPPDIFGHVFAQPGWKRGSVISRIIKENSNETVEIRLQVTYTDSNNASRTLEFPLEKQKKT